MTRVLHITPWYPMPERPTFGIWIRRHVDALAPFTENAVLHIDLDTGPWSLVREAEGPVTRIRCRVPLRSWRAREWVFAWLLRGELGRLNARDTYDVVNFHIAYPALVGYRLFRDRLPERRLITEHWSAYHYRFRSSRPLGHIRRIFSHGIPVVAVSESLALDIREFSGCAPDLHIVPNVVDTRVFYPGTDARAGHLFLCAHWASPKDPLRVLEEWANDPSLPPLRIAGGGPLWPDITRIAGSPALKDRITLLGVLSPEQVATELRSARALLHPTGYETFSVIAAEAACCGCPVLTDPTGALPEVLGEAGWFRAPGSSWAALVRHFERSVPRDTSAIARDAAGRYAPEAVGRRYAEVLLSL